MQRSARRGLAVAICGLLILVAAGSARAQGTGVQFVNFEAPAHKPIAVVDIAGTDYLLVANVPDGSVEVHTTNQAPPGFSAHQFLLRVPTGQRPVTVVAKPTPTGPAGGRRIYVANWLGDSITVFDLEPTPSGSPLPIRFDWVRTRVLGDEPTGITFLPANPSEPDTQPGGIFHEVVVVTFSAKAAFGLFFPGTLDPVLTNPFTGHIELMADTMLGSQQAVVAVKDPRAVAFAPAPAGPGPYSDQLWILNFRGGNEPGKYDFDLWGSNDLADAVVRQKANLPVHGELGTTNFNMAFAPNGDLWVAGTRARNKDLPSFVDSLGEGFHRNQVTGETGLVVSFLARRTNLTSSGSAGNLDVLDLNDSSQGTAPSPTQASLPIAQPTDLVIYTSSSAPTRIFITGFGSDTLGAVDVGSGGPSSWSVNRLDMAVTGGGGFSQNNLAGVMRGPRGLALKTSGASQDHRLYVYNRLESSVTVVDPGSLMVQSTFLLQGQIEPAHVVAGRKFLYSTKLSGDPSVANGGNVSCASCHVDGKSDFLAWNLGDGVPGGAGSLPGALGPNADSKGPMVTQPLQGLVDFEVADAGVQDTFYSNRPYHWRGDRGLFEQFNGAFVNLMGMPDQVMNPATPLFSKGLPDPDMTLYRNFVFSIHYPPNPNQPWNRVFSGSMFDDPANPVPAEIDDPTKGSGGQLGLKVFHIVESDSSKGCVNCHMLPVGSNSRLTDPELFHSESVLLPAQNLETAQLKALFLKESRLQRVVGGPGGTFQLLPSTAASTPAAAVTHEFGLVHTGESTISAMPGGSPSPAPLSQTINGFIDTAFGVNQAHLEALSHYVREFDSGVAPLVGVSGSVDYGELNNDPSGVRALIADLETQRLQVNVGIAVHARVSGVDRGFWHDATDLTTPFHEVAQVGLGVIGPFSRDGLLDLLDASKAVSDPDNLLIFHFTPLGSSRRVGRLQGGLAPPLATAAPGLPILMPSPTNTANVDVQNMTGEWTPHITSGFFRHFPGLFNAASVGLFQVSLVNHAPNGFGVTDLRHEAPRRFRVSGPGILDGACLRIFPPEDTDITSAPAAGQPPTTTPNTVSHELHFELPIYPGVDGTNVIWETAVETKPLALLFLMNGGFAGPVPSAGQPTYAVTVAVNPGDVTLLGPIGATFLNTTDLMKPVETNYHYVQVGNRTTSAMRCDAPGIQYGPGSWQRITVTP